jgi:hypothetical protein
MKRTTIQTTKAILASAAVAGLFAGSFLAQAVEKAGKAGEVADAKKGDTHDCKGKNSCKNKGGCKSGDNGCAGKNSCKGKGGCAVKDGKPNPPKDKKGS